MCRNRDFSIPLFRNARYGGTDLKIRIGAGISGSLEGSPQA
jgi:hypothetical protein